MTSLRSKTTSGMFWPHLQNIGGRGISFIATIILARMLTPEIFRLVGMLAIFLQMSQILVMAGFSEVLIGKKDTDTEGYSSVFWLDMVSLEIYAILFFAAPFIADFYGQSLLIQLIRVLSLIYVLNAFFLSIGDASEKRNADNRRYWKKITMFTPLMSYG